MTILRFSVLCPLALFMHSENLDLFYRGKEHWRFLSTVWLQQVSCTLSTVSPLKRQYARPQHCTCVLLWSSALPFAMDLEKSSRVVQLLPLHIVLIFFLSTSVSIFHEEESCESLCCNVFSLRWWCFLLYWLICISQAVCHFFCEYLIILAQRGKNRSGD